MERKCLDTLELLLNMYIIIINDMIEGLSRFAFHSITGKSFYGDSI